MSEWEEWEKLAALEGVPPDRRPSFYNEAELLIAYIRASTNHEAVAAMKEWLHDQARAYASDY